MSITKYSPFADSDEFAPGIRLLQDTVNRLFAEGGSARPWSPAVDVLETENEVVLKADVPGVDPNEVEVRMENGTLALKGERKFNSEVKEKGYHRVERGYGAFSRYFTLPETVDGEKVSASYKDGVLTVTLPKKEIAKPKSIKVQVN
ncbi:MAG TPA: Hsp20/alpha crystallin family protein [Bryobacteraceae bacterium]|jgi:HSP20 family protein|nr:Hsp20/alpha crystallin family protein [Bryobacteraceae bacterium]